MSIVGSEQWMYSSGRGFYDFPIEQSLRFEDGDSAYLSRTPASAGNQKTFTISAWVKRTELPASYLKGRILTCGTSLGTNLANSFFFGFDGDESLRVYQEIGGATSISIDTNAVYRDVSAWLNVICSVDTTQATASDRLKLYVNGEQITSLASSTYPSLNTDCWVNDNSAHWIGRSQGNEYSSFYLADYNLIDGQALDPTSFGEFKSGIWIPKDTSGLTFGTNGFRLEYADGAAIGDDTSGNTNDFTANNLVASDVVPDSPTNNFATWNTLDRYNYNAPSEGNLRALTAGNNGTQAATFAVSSGKWYFEVRNGTAGSGTLARLVGIGKEETNLATIPYNNADNYMYYSFNGNKYNGGTQTAYGDSWDADGDIIGIALDMDNGAIYFSKNGTWQNSATAAEIAAGTTTNAAFTGLSGTFVPIVSKTGGTSSNDPHHANFGQDSTFAGATTAGGNADENGYGDFAHPVPSGFLSLCSLNLPSGAIDTVADETPEDYFNTVLYSGDSTSSNGITGVGFQPDLVWIKERNGTFNHVVQDSVRGIGATSYYYLATDNTDAEASQIDGDGLLSLDTDGFTVGFNNTGAWNETGSTYASWNWKAGGSGVSNTDGSITSTVSVGATSQQNWFSIVSYTGNGTAGATVGHGLDGTVPDMIIVKSRDNARDWRVYHSSLGATQALQLNKTDAANTSSAFWNNTEPTSSVFSIGNVTTVNGSGEDYIAYCFANAEGLCKVGKYVGSAFVYTGFRPAFVLIKKATGGTFASGQSDWVLYDGVRNPSNPTDLELVPNSSQVEDTYGTGGEDIDMLSNGFKILTSSSQMTGTSTYEYIYLAIAEQPFKFANAR